MTDIECPARHGMYDVIWYRILTSKKKRRMVLLRLYKRIDVKKETVGHLRRKKEREKEEHDYCLWHRINQTIFLKRNSKNDKVKQLLS